MESNSSTQMSSASASVGAAASDAAASVDAAGAKRSLPTLFVSHGPGPYPILWAKQRDAEHAGLVESYQTVLEKALPKWKEKVKAIVVVSAHWETESEEGPLLVTAMQNPELLFDYYGFPQETYSLKYECDGSPAVATRVVELLEAAGLAAGHEHARGLDHGVFIPLLLAAPSAPVPVLQISLPKIVASGVRNAERAMALGAALAPLRSEGVLILGSGSATHGRQTRAEAVEFMGALERTICDGDDAAKRLRELREWERLPCARLSHGREEHLMPLHVAAAAAGGAAARTLARDFWRSLSMHHFAFGGGEGERGGEGRL